MGWVTTDRAAGRGLGRGDLPYVDAREFGAVGDGIADDTDALFDFYTYLIDNSKSGSIGAGTYLIREGVLSFDNGFTDKIFPTVITAGAQATIFKAANVADAPILSFSNGTATSPAGKYWYYGSHGGVKFLDTSGATAPNRHGLSLLGVQGVAFDDLIFRGMRGHGLHIPQALYLGNNPDPYHVIVDIKSLVAEFCIGYALRNDNYVGLNVSKVGFFRAIVCGGGWYGFGAGNVVEKISIGSTEEWALDDGTNVDSTGGTPSRFRVGLAEIDDPENGIRINKLQNSIFEQLRFVHRYHAGIGYYPRTCIDFGSGASPNITDVSIKTQHRIEAGGVKADIGVFTDLNSVGGNLLRANVEHAVIDNAGLGLTKADAVTSTGSASSTVAKVLWNGQVAFDTTAGQVSANRGSGSTVVASTGYGTAASKLLFDVEEVDQTLAMSSGEYTAPITGNYCFSMSFALACAIGTRVRFGIIKLSVADGVTLSMVANRTMYSVNAAATHYALTSTVLLDAGDKIYPVADQNTGSPIAASVVFSQAADNSFRVFLI